MRNIRLVLAYDGTDFCGWQRQPDASTIQSCLEGALHKLTGAPTQVCGSGRTDAGVHAAHQVANFHTASTIPCANFVKALNNLLPPTVRVKEADEVADSFSRALRRATQNLPVSNLDDSGMFTSYCGGLFTIIRIFLNRARMAQSARLLGRRARLHFFRGG